MTTLGRSTRSGGLAWALVGPTLALLVAFNVFPLVYDVVSSFTNAELIGGERRWVGGAHYARIFSDEVFVQALRRTALFVCCAVAIELTLGFVLALALRQDFRGKQVVLTTLLVPMMLSPAVMGLYWNLVLNGNYGVVNQALAGLGFDPPQWLTDRDFKFWSILLIDVWMWTPFMMLIALAGLSSIPTSIYEAAQIDRAGVWKVFRRITLPMCGPVLGLAVLFRATDALKQFDLVMAVSGPNDAATQTISTLLYQVVFRDGKVGLGAAYSCVILVVVIALATVFTRYVDRVQARDAA